MLATSLVHPSKFDDHPTWDEDWAKDWKHMTDIFSTIDVLRYQFQKIEVPPLLEIAQKQNILNLEKYAALLSNYIIQKYR